jgi:3-phenylpropionate/trans-cinnamate dioxygenase ferredoxin reductase component
MNSIRRIVIVGAGLAGARAAEAVRKDGYDGAIALLGEESERPYIRPPLSKEFLRGEAGRDAAYVHPETFYADNRIELETGARVTAVEPASHKVVLSHGRRLAFDRLLLATGAAPRKLTVPGSDLPGVVSLRTMADAEHLRTVAREAERAVVIGAGWIGTEVAASLRQLGLDVVVIAPGKLPLERVLGSEIAAVYRDLHTEHGVEFRFGRHVAAVTGRERAEGIRTTDGETIAAQLVVAGVGAEPRTELARSAGLSVSDGIEVGPGLETSVPGIFAAGDVASAWHPFYERRVRTEHWANAKFQGAAAGRLMLGANEPFDRIPYFYSDQYDLGMEYTGMASASDRLVVRGDLAAREFIAFWTRDGRVVAGMNANVWDVAKPIERLIRSRSVVDAEALADPSTPLDDLAPVPAAVS